MFFRAGMIAISVVCIVGILCGPSDRVRSVQSHVLCGDSEGRITILAGSSG